MKKSWCLLCALLLVWTTGCSNVKQLNRITFVTALGIDKEKTGVRVYAVVAIPGQFASLTPGGGGMTDKSGPNYMLTGVGEDVAQALYYMKRETARDIIFDHTKVFLFSEDTAREGLGHHLDLFLRREEFQLAAWIAVTKGSTKDVLQIKPQVPESVSDYLVDIFSGTGSDSMEIFPITLSRFSSYMNEPGRSPYAPTIRTQAGGNKILLAELALFRDSEMVGTATPDETKFIQMLHGSTKKPTSFTIGKRTYNLLRFRSKAATDGTKLKASLFVELELNQNSRSSLNESETHPELEAQLSGHLQDKIGQLIQKLKRLHVDPIGFGDKYRLLQHGVMDMDQWLTDIYPNMPVEVEVKVKLERTGLID